MKKKISSKDLVEQIAKLARERMTEGPVVSIEALKNKTSPSRPATLLVVEDDLTVRNVLQRIFERAGYRVLAASDGPELTEVLYDTYIDLVLLDVGLPWVNGYELAKMMKEHSDLKNVPIVFISAHGDQEAIKLGFASGAHDYITKPFDADRVVKTVATLLKLC
jgi:two-component system aerobic respiration control protein ArcA